MKKRLRKKTGKVIDEELWNFDITICKWMVPRLKRFKEINCAYPGIEPMETPEKWNAALDKMIRAFELAHYDPIDLDIDLNYAPELEFNTNYYKQVFEKWKKEVDEGLHLFAEYFNHLWI